jgi:Flp pilus assembly protein TadG
VSRPRRLRGSDEGAAAVEFALLLPILLLLVFGIIDFGRLLNEQITLTEAAREGARAESLGADAVDRATAVAPAMGMGVAIAGDCPDAADTTVTTSHDFEFVTPIPGLSVLFGGGLGGTVTLTGQGNMPCLA